MLTLQLDTKVDGKDRFTARTKKEVLNKLRKALGKATDEDLNGTEVSVDYKENRKIVCFALDEHYKNLLSKDSPWKWGVEIEENGVGETQEFATRQEAIDRFIDICSEKGEHWQ